MRCCSKIEKIFGKLIVFVSIENHDLVSPQLRFSRPHSRGALSRHWVELLEPDRGFLLNIFLNQVAAPGLHSWDGRTWHSFSGGCLEPAETTRVRLRTKIIEKIFLWRFLNHLNRLRGKGCSKLVSSASTKVEPACLFSSILRLTRGLSLPCPHITQNLWISQLKLINHKVTFRLYTAMKGPCPDFVVILKNNWKSLGGRLSKFSKDDGRQMKPTWDGEQWVSRSCQQGTVGAPVSRSLLLQALLREVLAF